MNGRRRGLMIALAVGVLATAGCTGSGTGTNTDWCVPALSVDPDPVPQGGTFALLAGDGCTLPAPAEGWTIVIAPVGDADAGLRVAADQRMDADFRIEVTLPEDFPVGESFAGIENWDYTACDDTGTSCAAASADFTVTTP